MVVGGWEGCFWSLAGSLNPRPLLQDQHQDTPPLKLVSHKIAYYALYTIQAKDEEIEHSSDKRRHKMELPEKRQLWEKFTSLSFHSTGWQISGKLGRVGRWGAADSCMEKIWMFRGEAKVEVTRHSFQFLVDSRSTLLQHSPMNRYFLHIFTLTNWIPTLYYIRFYILLF